MEAVNKRQRESAAIIFAGTNGSGKTTQAAQYARATGKRIVWIACKVPNKDFQSWKRVYTIEEAAKNKENVLCLLRDLGLDAAETKQAFDFVRVNFSNCVIVWDDAGDYTDSNITREVRRLMTSRRQSAQDVFWIFHSLGDIPPALWRYSNYAVIFLCIEAPKRAEAKTPDFDKIMRAWANVKMKGKYFSEVVQLSTIEID